MLLKSIIMKDSDSAMEASTVDFKVPFEPPPNPKPPALLQHSLTCTMNFKPFHRTHRQSRSCCSPPPFHLSLPPLPRWPLLAIQWSFLSMRKMLRMDKGGMGSLT